VTTRPSTPWVTNLVRYLIVICALSFVAMDARPSEAQPTPTATARATANAILGAFAARNGQRLASFVHPTKGLRFSPSAFVNPSEDVVLSRSQIASFWTDPKIYLWGYAESTGDPIELTPRAYADKFILDHSYARAPYVSVNNDRSLGTTRNNAAEIYSTATRVEYYIPPSKQDALDWAAIRLVLEQVGGSWRLVGVIHDMWSP
jgi:hypothetical protein